MRVDGLDVARAVALLGMFAAHVGDADPPDGWGWLVVFDGRASALFALLAGVSISLMLAHRGGPSPAPADVRHTRIRVAVRGWMLIVLSWVLSALLTPVDIILDNLGVMFLLVLVAFRWPAWLQAAVGVVVLASGRALLELAGWPLVGVETPVIHELWSWHYPALVWVGYVLVGMAVGRWAPWRGRPVAALGVAGALAAVVAYGAGLALGGAWSEDDTSWTSVAPHSYSAFEMLGNAGVAFATIAAAVVLARLAPRALWPLASTGRMTLTLYTAQIVVISVVGTEIVWEPSNTAWVVLSVASVGAACAWRHWLGQGPLERLLTAASTSAADADARKRGAMQPR